MTIMALMLENIPKYSHLVHWYNCFICDLGNTCYCSIDKELELPLEKILQAVHATLPLTATCFGLLSQ